MIDDLRLALRLLSKSPGFTVVSLLTLALGIGVNTSMFSGLQALLVPHLPYPQPDQLVRLFRTNPHSQRLPLAAPDVADLRDVAAFEHVAAVTPQAVNFAEPGQPAERIRALFSNASLFPLLGLPPHLGRGFTPEEEVPGRNEVVVLADHFWRRRFNADPAILGRTLRLDGQSVTVIGVLPAEFQNRREWGRIDVVRPLVFTPEQLANRFHLFLQTFARLRPGATPAEANAALAALVAGWRTVDPGLQEVAYRAVDLATSGMAPQGRVAVWMILALAGLVLLIACANLANLQFARTSLRSRDLAIRGALGAPRSRLLRQLLSESLLLAAGGGLAGLWVAHVLNRFITSRLVEDGEPLLQASLNLPVLAFTLAAATLAGLAFGLVPAWLGARADFQNALRQNARSVAGDRAQHRVRHALIIAQVSLALVLLAGAGLVVHGLSGFGTTQPGWKPEGVTVGQLQVSGARYPDAGSKARLTLLLVERLQTVPGVTAAAAASHVPLSHFRISTDITTEDTTSLPTGGKRSRHLNFVSPGYFETLGMTLLEGRTFRSSDGAEAPPVIIINERLARACWPDGSALGKRIGSPGAWSEVIGVVNDVGFPSDPAEPGTYFQSYRPLAQDPQPNLMIAVRGTVTPEQLRRTVTELDPDLPLSDVAAARTMIDRVAEQASVAGWLLCGFALLGLALATLGIYGVMAGFVAQRTREIGVRMALGAQLADVYRLVVGRGMTLACTGALFGLLGAIGVARVFAHVVPGLNSHPGLVLGSVSVLLLVVAAAACVVPARRAVRIEPAVALRAD